MKNAIVVLIIILSTAVSAQNFNGFGVGISMNRLNDKNFSITTIDATYVFSNFYFEFGATQTTKTIYTTFVKFNAGYTFKLKHNFLIPFLGMAYESNVDPKLNLGLCIITHFSENVYLINGLGTTERFKIGIGIIFKKYT